MLHSHRSEVVQEHRYFLQSLLASSPWRAFPPCFVPLFDFCVNRLELIERPGKWTQAKKEDPVGSNKHTKYGLTNPNSIARRQGYFANIGQEQWDLS